VLTRRGDNVGVLLYFEALSIELIPASGWCSFFFCSGETSSGNFCSFVICNLYNS
jgi:hypothetical protein